jgi:signal transduction histidine kinase/CHASE3 domain sensor protein
LRPPRWNTYSAVQAGYVAALICLAAISVAAYVNLQRLTVRSAWVSHTDQVIAHLQQLLSVAINAESAARGYVITGDAVYVEPFEESRQHIAQDCRVLRALTADNVEQQRSIDELQSAIDARLAVLNELVAARGSRGFDAARQLMVNGPGHPMQENIRATVERMTTVERELLQKREQGTESQAIFTQVTLVAGGVLAFAFVGLSFFAMRRDFAGRRRAEQALQQVNVQLEERVEQRTAELSIANGSLSQSERRFRALVSATSDGIFRMSADWSRMQHLQGPDITAPAGGSTPNWLERYIDTDFQPEMQAAVDEAIRNKSVFQLEHPIQRADGTQAWIYSRAVPLTAPDGSITEWFGAATDITARRKAEERLYTQLARLKLLGEITRSIGERQDTNSIFQVTLRTLEEQLPIDFGCIASFDPATREIEVTRVGAKSRELGLSMAVTEQARFAMDQNGLSRCCLHDQLVYEPDIAGSVFPFTARLAAGGLHALVIAPLSVGGKVSGLMAVARHTASSFQSADCEFLRQLSEHLALAATQSQLHTSLQRAYDDLRDTQQSVMEQERLRVLGQMASGIAHDINNALSPAALYLQSLLESDASLSAEARASLTITEQAIQDVAGTIARLREFYRPRERAVALAPLDLNAVLTKVMDLTQVRWRDMPQEHGFVIEPRIDLAPALPQVLGAEPEVRDALMNLVFNAIDAMPAGGTLSMRTSHSPTGVVVAIRDTGVGMSEDVRQRCLEPFFTTKGERGTGLGLAMVYGMVQRHGAALDVESAPGRGTGMRLTFPLAPSTDEDVVLTPLAAPRPARILLVDDDPLLLQSLREVLVRDGHDVTMADGGQAGIDAFNAACDRGRSFPVVITDLGMPNVDGRAVSSVIKARAPSTTVILLTGWGHRLQGEQKPEYVDHVLNKPPRLMELRAALASVATIRE